MSINNVGGGSSPLSNLFLNAQSGPSSKLEQAREAGLTAKKNQQNAFAGKMQSLVQAVSSQMDSGYGSKYTNAVKIRNSVEQGVTAAGNTEVQKASEANLDEIKAQIEQKAKEAQARRRQEAESSANQAPADDGSIQPGSNSTSPETSADLKLPGSGGPDDAAFKAGTDIPISTGTGDAEAQFDRPEIQAGSTSTGSSSSDGGGNSGGGKMHIDVVV